MLIQDDTIFKKLHGETWNELSLWCMFNRHFMAGYTVSWSKKNITWYPKHEVNKEPVAHTTCLTIPKNVDFRYIEPMLHYLLWQLFVISHQDFCRHHHHDFFFGSDNSNFVEFIFGTTSYHNKVGIQFVVVISDRRCCAIQLGSWLGVKSRTYLLNVWGPWSWIIW